MADTTAAEQESFTLEVSINALSTREPYSQKINEECGEGGALNANYRTVEAVAKAANRLGDEGFSYGRDFSFKTVNGGDIVFAFGSGSAADAARTLLGSAARVSA